MADDKAADRGRIDFHAMEKVERHPEDLGDNRTDNVAMGDHHHRSAWKSFGGMFDMSPSALLSLSHAFASGRSGARSNGVPPVPLRILSEFSEGLACPITKIQFLELWHRFDRQFRPMCDYCKRRLLRALQRAGMDGINRQSIKPRCDPLRLSAAIAAQPNSGYPAGQNVAQLGMGGVTDQQDECGQEVLRTAAAMSGDKGTPH
jgi:hypothetical protein